MKKLFGFFIVIIPVIAILVAVLTSTIVGANVPIAVTSLDLMTEAGSVNVNTSLHLEYEVYPKQAQNREVLFSSSDESIATVNQDGTVNFIGFGTVYVTATTVDGNKTQMCEFNVVSDNPFGINLTVDKREIQLDDSAQLSAAVFPLSAVNKGVVFTSSDESIASVDANGIVTALGCGEVTCTATTLDGNIQQTIELYVTKKATALSLTVDNTLTESEFVTVCPTFMPYTTSEKYRALSFVSSDDSIATVSRSGRVVFSRAGAVDITAATDYGVTASVRLYYTGGLPSQFECPMAGTFNTAFCEDDLSRNSGTIPLTFPNNADIRNVTYFSSNTSVVTVDEFGAYTILGGGIANVSVTADVAKVVGTELVLTTATKVIGFQVSRDASRIELVPTAKVTDSTYTIVADIIPRDATNTALYYESLDSSTAVVSARGVVTFLTVGTARIRVTTYNGISAEIAVTSSMGYPTSATIVRQSEYLLFGGTATLSVDYVPLSTTVKGGVWSVEDSTICSVDASGTVTGLREGSTDVYFTYNVWNDTTHTVEEQVLSTEFTVYKRVEHVVANVPNTFELFGEKYVTSLPSFALSYTCHPTSIIGLSIRYVSEDPTVATVDAHGVVYFKKVGTASFHAVATAERNNVVSESVTIQYVGNSPTAATLTVTGDRVVWPNESIDVDVVADSIKPKDCTDTTFVLTADNDNVSISGHTVTATKAGVSVVTATFVGGLKRTFTVSIRQPVTSIIMESNMPTAGVTFKNTVRVGSTVLPANAYQKGVAYSSGDTTIATVTSTGVVTFLRAGTVTIYATAADGQGAVGNISLTSTCGNITAVALERTEILTGVPLTFTFLPADATGIDVDVTVNTQSPTDGTEDVLIESAGSFVGQNAGSATVTLSVTNSDASVITANATVTVGFSSCSITGFSIDDITVYEGDSFAIRPMVKDILPTDTDELYIAYMTLTYSTTASSEYLTVSADGNVHAIRYGIFRVTAQIDEATVSFNVTVKTKDIVIDSIRDANIASGGVFTKVTEQSALGEDIDVLVTGHTSVELGMPSPTTTSLLFNVDFSYRSSDTDIATVDDDGTVTFLKAGLVAISVYQTVVSATAPTGTDGTAFEDRSSESDMTVYLRYNDRIQSFKVTLKGTALSATGDNVFQYSSRTLPLQCTDIFPKGLTAAPILSVEENIPNAEGIVVLTADTAAYQITGGGKAIIKVTAGDAEYTYSIVIKRYVSRISALSNITTTSDTVYLATPRLEPADATDRTYTTTVSDTSVATLDGNKLTFAKAGKVTITVRANDITHVTATYTVTSTCGGITSFSLPSRDISLVKGANHTITPSVVPADAVGYTFAYSITANTPNGGGTQNVVSVSTNGVISALCGGTATVQVSTVDAYGETLTDSISVSVSEEASTLDLSAPSPTILDTDSSGRFVTARNSITLTATVGSATASDRTISWSSSDTNVATVTDGVVTFLSSGYVTINVCSNANSLLRDSVSFHYVTALLGVSLNSVDTALDIGDSVTFTAVDGTALPRDLTPLDYSLELVSSTLNGGGTDSVIDISGTTVTARRGGTATVRVTVSGYTLPDLYVFTVASPMTDITLAETSKSFDSKHLVTKTYQIQATSEPSHTDESLGYSIEGSVTSADAEVSATGLVTLKSFGSYTIRIYAIGRESLYRTVLLTYTQNELQYIELQPMVLPQTALFGGQQYTLSVKAYYLSSSETLSNADVSFVNNNPELCTVSTSGVISATNNVYGTASVTVNYDGKSDDVSFVVAPITNMSFVLTNVGEELCGIKGERVFGTKSFNSPTSTSLSDTTRYYQMEFTGLTQTHGAPYTYASSDEAIATVDSNGRVYRIKAGVVTISCTPKYRYATEGASYTFRLVEGVDVYNIAQFEVYTASVSDGGVTSAVSDTPAVLHSDIIYTSSYAYAFWWDGSLYRSFRGLSSLYGNGHTIDATAKPSSSYESPITFHVQASDVLIDNVVLIGDDYDDPNSPNLSDFSDKAVTLSIRAHSRGIISNVTVANTVIKGGRSNVYAYAADFTLSGCVIKNAYEGNVLLNTYATTFPPTYCTMRNCVVENSLMPSIDLKVDKEDVPDSGANHLTIEGDLYINNWRQKSEIPNDDTYGKQLRSTFDELVGIAGLAYTSGGTQYINFGITRLSADGWTSDFINNGVVNENLSYLNTVTANSTYLTYKVTLDMATYYGNSVPAMNGLNTPGRLLVPGTVIDSAVYPYIRDTDV